MERLHETHSRAARPIKAAGCGGLEVEGKIAERDGPQAAIGEHADAGRNGVCEPEVIGGGEAVDHHPNLTFPGQCVDHVARVGIGRLSGEPVVLEGVVEAARNPPQVAGSNQPVEGLIDCGAWPQVGKVLRGPDTRLRRGGDAVPDGGWDAECLSGHK
jgi:hypothetical protein